MTDNIFLTFIPHILQALQTYMLLFNIFYISLGIIKFFYLHHINIVLYIYLIQQ